MPASTTSSLSSREQPRQPPKQWFQRFEAAFTCCERLGRDCFGGVFNQLVDDYFSLQPQRKAFRRRHCFTSNFMRLSP
ncbi:hypothetical protein PRIC1_008056 [Phytophthora ramorum]